ncbi:MAG: phenylalanine--tRNA ligase subunit beta [Candidatus Pacebacteria bacterium]|nr:phenylalanine--tRNA ligase subunit beta [Candidatus Paceibacterota bacterium]
MTVSYNWLKTFFDKPLPEPKKLAHLLTMHCFENESLVKKGNDWIFGIDVLPDRAGDGFSYTGIARECAAVLNRKIVLPLIKIKEDKKLKTASLISVEIKNKTGCLRYASRVLTDVKLAPSPKWLQERLLASGLFPINNVVDATNYIMLETGQPLHAFDYDKIGENKKIIVRNAKPNEKITTINGREYKLDPAMLVISGEDKALAIAGIKGGQAAEISGKTKTIVLEAANFNAKLISQTARKLNLMTDASARFSHNIDPNLVDTAINRVVSLLQEIAGAKAAAGLVDIYPKKSLPRKIKLEIKEVGRIIGIDIPAGELVSIFGRLGIKILAKTKEALTLQIPAYRQDITIPENLIEEAGRIYGYEKISHELPIGYLAPVARNIDLFWQNYARDIFKSVDYLETYNYSFVSDLEKDIFSADLRRIENPVNSDFKYLRNSLLPLLLKNLKENLKSFKKVKLLETGKIFLPEKSKTKEERSLAGVFFDGSIDAEQTFLRLRGEMIYMLEKCGIKEFGYGKSRGKAWHKDNALMIEIKNSQIGCFGEINPDILASLKINERVFGFEINFDVLQKFCSEKEEFEPISFHPQATRDISGFISAGTSVEKITNAIKSAGGKLVKTADPFDVYAGKGVPEGKQSVSFHIIYQSSEKTLDGETIDALQKKVLTRLADEFGWEERK